MNKEMMKGGIGRLAATILAAGAMMLVLGAGAAVAAGDGILRNCYEANPCLGSDNSETIVGTDDPDTIKGLAGDDKVYGHEEMDVIYGGSGNDHLVGELGSDTAYGGAGNDIIAAAADPEDQPMHEIFYDYSYGGEGADTIYAVDGYRDEIYCGKGGNDKAYFDVGLDTVKGCEYRYPLLPPLV